MTIITIFFLGMVIFALFLSKRRDRTPSHEWKKDSTHFVQFSSIAFYLLEFVTAVEKSISNGSKHSSPICCESSTDVL